MPELAVLVAAGAALQVALIVVSLGVTHALTAALRRRGIRRIQPRQGGAAVARHEWRYMAINLLASVLLIGLLAHLWQDGAVRVRLDRPDVPAIAWELMVYLAGLDIYTYAVHRVMHTRWLYRHVHAVHHRSRAPAAITAYSFHPLEWLTLGLYVPLALAVIDCHVITVALVFVLQGLLNTVPHCGYEYAPRGWYAHPVSRLFLTAFFHELHHQRVTCNYGTITTVWDRLLGTIPTDFDEQFTAAKERCRGP